MILHKAACLRMRLGVLLILGLTPSTPAAEKQGLLRPVLEKVYPNPARHGEILYLEGRHFVASARMGRAQSPQEEWRPAEGTYVEFTTRNGVKRVPGYLIPNPPTRGAQVCSVSVPQTAIAGPVKIIIFATKDARPIGSMSAAVPLSILDEAATGKPAGGWAQGTVSLVKAVPKKLLRDAFYYQTERTARAAQQAFVRQENLRLLDSQYDINRGSYFNTVPQLRASQPGGSAEGAEAWLRPGRPPSFAAQFFAPPKSKDQTPSYMLANRETLQKDIQEDVYNYMRPLFERWTRIKLEPERVPAKTGFTRPQIRFAYSLGLGANHSLVSQGGLTRNVGFRLDFDYVRLDPQSEQMRKILSFTIAADSRRTHFESDREERMLFLIRFR